ncbi:MAG TPA: hypothetical protein VFB22_01670 [Candidatus Baltobacteraceae bacterium]|nr:hypothetical protein [Candidatus Baltobacteraceae bacterium]
MTVLSRRARNTMFACAALAFVFAAPAVATRAARGAIPGAVPTLNSADVIAMSPAAGPRRAPSPLPKAGPRGPSASRARGGAGRDPFAWPAALDAPARGIAVEADLSARALPMPLPFVPRDAASRSFGTPSGFAPPAGVRVAAIVTGEHPAALVTDGSGTRLVGVGERVDGTRITAIAERGVRLADGRVLSLDVAPKRDPAPNEER